MARTPILTEPQDETPEFPDDEALFLESVGMAPDGSALMNGDMSVTGLPWQLPDDEL